MPEVVVDPQKRLKANAVALEVNLESMNKSLDDFRMTLRHIQRTGMWEIPNAPWNTFDEFCQQKLNMHPSRAYQIIRAANAKEFLLAAFAESPDMLSIAQKLPEGALREVVALPQEKMPEIVERAVKTQGNASGESLRKVAVEMGLKKDKKPKALPPVTEAVWSKIHENVAEDQKQADFEEWLEIGLSVDQFRIFWEELTDEEQELFKTQFNTLNP